MSWDRLRVQAFEAGLTNDQFWDLTFHEVALVVKGYAQRIEKQRMLSAWAQANLINVHIPKGRPRVTPKKLLGGRSSFDDFDNVEEFKKALKKTAEEKRKTNA